MTTSACAPPQRASRPRRRAKVSLTPLIDVVFILLVFFMLASSFLDWRSIALDAAGKPGAAAGMEGALLVDVSAEGPRVAGELLSLDTLAAQVADRVRERPDQRFLIRPARGLALQGVVDVMDRMALAGARDIALMPGT